uniref:Uncharacterized protein n=1 Tax=Anguilla anguilla TaxID=7936 RepID=A0A0E9Q392_ANGAN
MCLRAAVSACMFQKWRPAQAQSPLESRYDSLWHHSLKIHH